MTELSQALTLAEPREPVSMELFTLLRDQATTLIKTGFLPAHIKTPEQAVAVVLIGRELGIPMMQALRKVFVIQGTPCLAAELMLALAERTGEIEDRRIEDDGMTCTVTIKRRGRKSPVLTSFSMADAKGLKLDAKDNWIKQPTVMRRWRAISANLRLTFPDAIGGMYSLEEVAPEVAVDVTGTPLAPLPVPPDSTVNSLLPRRIGEMVTPPPEPESPRPPAVSGPEMASPGPGREELKPERPDTRPAPPDGTRFTINEKEVVTAGITKDTLLKAYKLGALVDEREGKGKAKDLLGRGFGVEHRTELTESEGKTYVAALAGLINKHSGKQ